MSSALTEISVLKNDSYLFNFNIHVYLGKNYVLHSLNCHCKYDKITVTVILTNATVCV